MTTQASRLAYERSRQNAQRETNRTCVFCSKVFAVNEPAYQHGNSWKCTDYCTKENRRQSQPFQS